MKSKIWPYFLGIGLLVVDQGVKWWVIRHPSFLIKNQGMILGVGTNLDLFLWITFALILILALFMIEKPGKHLWAMNLMLAGVISNIFDRFFRDGIIDYFRITMVSNFAFNLADVFILVGIIIYVFQFFKERRRGEL